MTQHIAVVGAGMVGLSTAWHLQEQGIQVTVLERDHVAAGASWGNAGWLTPGLTTPLPEPAVLTYGVRAVLSRNSPVYVPVRADASLLRFLTGFARHSTARQWGVAMRAYGPVNRQALAAYDELAAGGVSAGTREADPFLACYGSEQERAVLLEELEHIQAMGQEVKFDVISGEEARAGEPALSEKVTAAIRLHGQRFLNPPEFVASLADAVRQRGGTILEGASVERVRDRDGGVDVLDSTGQQHRFDSVVLANGTWLGDLAKQFGVRKVVQAGRGYSFSVACESVPRGPVYLPAQRVACTPLPSPTGDRLRVAGMMEFRAADDPLDPHRINAIVEAARPFLQGVDLDQRQDEWVGSRPCTADGLPLIGGTSSPRVFVAGGHGMWGIALGPITGKLLAERIVTGTTPAELLPFDPLR